MKINYQFITYKKYNNFLQALQTNQIRNDSIVFIEDKLRIWAHNKEYYCGEQNSVTIDGDYIILKDESDNEERYKFVGDESFEEFKTTLNTRLDSINIQLESLRNKDTNLQSEIDKKQNTLTIDSSIDINSPNVVENHAIASALNEKISLQDVMNVLEDYITANGLEVELNKKQNVLYEGYGISIKNDTVAVTLDDDVFVITSVLPIENISTSKIYLKEEIEDGVTKYYAYRYNGEEWIPLGEKTPNINLTDYLKTTDAEDTYQHKGTYLTPYDIVTIYNTIADEYQKKGDYAQVGYVNQKLEWLQGIIAQKYVLKKDVYALTEGNWSEDEIVPVGDTTEDNPSTNSRLVTLTTQAYDALVQMDAVDPNTYYFTYEGEETTSNWTFGDTFPVIFHEETGIGTFPIVLGEDNIGTFPINLT